MTDFTSQFLFIVNPNSGHGKHLEVIAAIKESLPPTQYEIALTDYAGHGSLLAQKGKCLGYKAVIACGGDGTVNEIAQVLIGSETPLGIIPVGSGNGLARHLNLPLTISEAVHRVAEFRVFKMDTATINGHPFLGMAGIGFDAFIGKKFANYGKRGFGSYIKLVSKEYLSFKQKKVVIHLGEQKLKRRVLMLSFANSGQYGNNAIIAPKASLNSGKIGLCLVKKFPLWKSPYIAALLFSGKINQSKYLETIWVEKAIIKQKKKIAHLDGEPLKLGRTLHLEVVPESLNVLV